MEPFILLLCNYRTDLAMFRAFRVIFFLIMSSYYLVRAESRHSSNNRSVDIEGKIVGGTSVELEKYPFAVQFFNLGALCGGVIMNSWCILTSAHCFDMNKDISEMRIQVGSKYIYDFNAKRYRVHSFVLHEDYSKEAQFQSDIAMVFSEEQIRLGKLAKKAILVNSDKWMNKKETRFIVTGWGWTKYGGPLSELGLMMTFLKYVPMEECSRLHKINLTKDMFCLYGLGRRDTCKGDSGGGVLWHGMIVGLTSHGDGCAKQNKPSVYTNIWYMREWIKTQFSRFMAAYCNILQITNQSIA